MHTPPVTLLKWDTWCLIYNHPSIKLWEEINHKASILENVLGIITVSLNLNKASVLHPEESSSSWMFTSWGYSHAENSQPQRLTHPFTYAAPKNTWGSELTTGSILLGEHISTDPAFLYVSLVVCPSSSPSLTLVRVPRTKLWGNSSMLSRLALNI